MTTESELEGWERPPQSLWNRILAEPARAPEYIALAAADHFGPEAEEWVRIAGPGHTPKKLARIAYRKHVRLARLEGGLLGLARDPRYRRNHFLYLYFTQRSMIYFPGTAAPSMDGEQEGIRMARIAGELLINRPVDEVFDFVADEQNEPRYNPRIRRAEKLSPGPIGRGTRFRAEAVTLGRTVGMTIDYTAYERPGGWGRPSTWPPPTSSGRCVSTRSRMAPG